MDLYVNYMVGIAFCHSLTPSLTAYALYAFIFMQGNNI